MDIHQLEIVIRALESIPDGDDKDFLRHLLENKDNELVKSEVQWLEEIKEQLNEI